MLLHLDPMMHEAMTGNWKDSFEAWFGTFGIFPSDVFYVECVPEANVVWVDVHVRNEEGNFYRVEDEIVSARYVVFYENMPPRIFFWEWRQAVIACRGRQGA